MAKKPDRSAHTMRTAILVLGMHRSGTSALARIVSFLGAALPRRLVPANESNPKGHWESAPLVALHDELLTSLGSSWDDWRAPGQKWRETENAAKFMARMQQSIDDEFAGAPLLVLKDPRMCRTLPYWMTLLEKTGIRTAPLIIVRNPLEVAESLAERDGIPFEKSMLLWLRHNLDAESETRHLPRNIVTLDALLEDWKLLAVQSAARLSITWPRQPLDAVQDVREFLDLELHNHRATLAELEAHTEVPSWVKAAYRALTQLCDEPKAADPKRELDRVRAMFSESAKVFGVVAFAQTEALKQAEIDVSEARARAQDADNLREELKHERSAHSELAAKHQTQSAKLKTVESELSTQSTRAVDFERKAKDFEAQVVKFTDGDFQRRAEKAELRVTTLTKEVAELERARGEMQSIIKTLTDDAGELKTLAVTVSKRTEWIEGELKKQNSTGSRSKAEVEDVRAKLLSLSAELKSSMANALALSKELAVAKEQIHAHETRAIKASAEAKQYAEALRNAKDKLTDLEADDRAAQLEISELRAELAEAWALTGTRPSQYRAPPSEPLHLTGPFTDAETRAQRVEEDLRFERMHVQQLERRLGSWMGLASAALRKITRLGGTAVPPRRKPGAAKRLAQSASRS